MDNDKKNWELRVLMKESQRKDFLKLKNLFGSESNSDCAKVLMIVGTGWLLEQIEYASEEAQPFVLAKIIQSISVKSSWQKRKIDITDDCSLQFLRDFINKENESNNG